MFGIIPKVSKAIMASNMLPATMKSFICAPAGPLTIFFWAPAIKWIIIFANVQTFKMPVDMISNRLQMAWTRYSFVITPKNYMLAAVNSFMAGTAMWQIYRKNRGDVLLKKITKHSICVGGEKEITRPDSKKKVTAPATTTTATTASATTTTDKKPEQQQQQQQAAQKK